MLNEVTPFAATTYRGKSQKFGIKTDDRRRHMYLIGKTGMGKSTVLENMIVADIRAGHGVAVVDPHGDLVEKVMEFIPDDRVKDVIFFNPSDMDYPIAFNIVEHVPAMERHLVASGLIGVFKKLWADSWGPRLEYILRNAILAVLDHPESNLLGVIKMLSDKKYRKMIVANVEDPVVKAFWEKEFAGYADKFASEAVSPIQNKVGQFLSSSLIRNVVGQIKSSLNIREIMDDQKILLMNLSKGRIGEDNSALLGAMMITKIQLAAMSRVDTPEKERKDFYLYIDEFQNFSTESFANILSEARKYRLNLIMAHQYIEQLGDVVRAAVFGNVGTMVSFRVGATDAEELVKEFSPIFNEEDIVNISKYEFFLKLMIDGVASQPFSAKGLMPLKEEEKTDNTERAIANTRKNYAKPRIEVEEEIMKAHFGDDDGGDAGKDDKLQDKGFNVLCSMCGTQTKTPFEPDGVRPVYCKDCLNDLKTGKKQPIKSIPKEYQYKKPKADNDTEKTENAEKKEKSEKSEILKMSPSQFKKMQEEKTQVNDTVKKEESQNKITVDEGVMKMMNREVEDRKQEGKVNNKLNQEEKEIKKAPSKDFQNMIKGESEEKEFSLDQLMPKRQEGKLKNSSENNNNQINKNKIDKELKNNKEVSLDALMPKRKNDEDINTEKKEEDKAKRQKIENDFKKEILGFENKKEDNISNNQQKNKTIKKSNFPIKQPEHEVAKRENLPSRQPEHEIAKRENLPSKQPEHEVAKRENLPSKQPEHEVAKRENLPSKQPDHEIVKKDKVFDRKENKFSKINNQKLKNNKPQYNNKKQVPKNETKNDKVEEFSLSQLGDKSLVGFGRKKKTDYDDQRKKTIENIKSKAPSTVTQEKDIEEGEDIFFE